MARRFILMGALFLGGCLPPAGRLAVRDLALEAPACAPETAVEANPLTGAHPLPFYIEEALRRNPEVQAMRHRAAGLAEQVRQVTTLPDPMLSDTFWPITMNSPQTVSGRMPNALMLSQEFPWFGKLRLRGAIADLETRIALTELAEAELKVIEAVKTAYYDLYFHQAALAITTENEKLLQDYIRFAEARYKVGQVSQQDVLRSQVELTKTQDMLLQLRQGLQLAQADLARLLSTAPAAELLADAGPLAVAPPAELERLYEMALTQRPELQGKLHAVLRDQHQVELAHKDYYPDVKLGVGWDVMTRQDALDPLADGKDNLGFNVSLNIPVWYHKLRAGVRQAEHKTSESLRQYDAARDDAFRMIRRAVAQTRALEAQIKLYRDQVLPRAEQTLKVSATDYQVGRIDMLTLIDNWTMLLQFQIQLRRLEANLGQTLAMLERAVGGQLTQPETIPAPRAVEPKP